MPVFGILIGLFILISIIKAGAKSAAGGGGTQQPKKPGLSEGILRSIELEQELKYGRQKLQQAPTSQPDQPEKPVIPHQTSDCTGGSIHDGYHEGTFKKPASASSAEGMQNLEGARRMNYAPGRTGQGMRSSEGTSASHANGLPTKEEVLREVRSSLAYEKASASHSVNAAASASKPAAQEPQKSGIEKLTEAISSKPPMVQGIMWAEILGKPLSEN